MWFKQPVNRAFAFENQMMFAQERFVPPFCPIFFPFGNKLISPLSFLSFSGRQFLLINMSAAMILYVMDVFLITKTQCLVTRWPWGAKSKHFHGLIRGGGNTVKILVIFGLFQNLCLLCLRRKGIHLVFLGGESIHWTWFRIIRICQTSASNQESSVASPRSASLAPPCDAIAPQAAPRKAPSLWPGLPSLWPEHWITPVCMIAKG